MVKLFLKALLIIGILIRIYLQFVTPSFNVDEIALGNNIKSRDMIGLLYPLDNFQSAPPLYLVTQKILISLPFNVFWIKIKLFSFFVSVGVVILAYKLTKKLFSKEIFSILFLSFFCFSPFIIYHTLTLKQYGLDLLFLLFIYSLFEKSIPPLAIYFILWCLLSNIGLFFTVGYLIIQFIHIIKKDFKLLYITNHFFNLRNISIALGPMIYILYFVWFMRQNGATELKIFMQEYWANSFIPMDVSIFKYCLSFAKGFINSFVSSYSIVGIPFFIISFFGILYYTNFRHLHFSNKFLIVGIFIHILLNIFHLYPLSDRLYLYLALPVYLIFLQGFDFIVKNSSRNWLKNFVYMIITSAVLSYFTYLPYRENDVHSLLNYLANQSTKKVVYSSRTLNSINDFNNFTEGAFIKGLDNRSMELNKGNLYVSAVHHKYGHKEKTAKEEYSTSRLIDSGVLNIVHKIDGFNIYEVQ